MMLIYAALLNIPDELIDAARVDGLGHLRIFLYIKLPLVLPTIGLVSILTFVGNFNAFDLIYSVKGALAGPNFATDILGTFFYRTFFGNQLQLGNPTMGAAVATMMFFIILAGVCAYLFLLQRRMQPLHVLKGSLTMLRQRVQSFGVHAILIAYSALALGPILLVVMNSFKARNAIFGAPLAPPNGATFSLIGYAKVLRALACRRLFRQLDRS